MIPPATICCTARFPMKARNSGHKALRRGVLCRYGIHVNGQDNNSVVIRLKENTTGNLKILDMPLIEDGKLLYSIYDDKNVDIAVVLFNGGFISENNL